jgi:pimeloyl-ACP methyl ester carboxylesterase
MFEIKSINRGFKDDLVLIPGWATDYRIFQLLELDYNYFLVSAFSPFSLREDLSQYLKRNSIGRISLLGWSMGAYLAADFTVNNPDKVEHLILLGVKQRYEKDALDEIKIKLKENKLAWLYKFYLDCFSRKDTEGPKWFRKTLLKDYLKEQDLTQLLSGLDYLSQASFDMDSLKQLESLIIMQGSDDLIAPIKDVEELKDKLPKAKLSRVENRGHILWIK